MHTKINEHPNAPNFLTHVLWSKTMIEKQQVHLELLLILHYLITKESMHIFRINTSDHSKIVINSPEV
jgi:hypothetical protein